MFFVLWDSCYYTKWPISVKHLTKSAFKHSPQANRQSPFRHNLLWSLYLTTPLSHVVRALEITMLQFKAPPKNWLWTEGSNSSPINTECATQNGPKPRARWRQVFELGLQLQIQQQVQSHPPIELIYIPANNETLDGSSNPLAFFTLFSSEALTTF